LCSKYQYSKHNPALADCSGLARTQASAFDGSSRDVVPFLIVRCHSLARSWKTYNILIQPDRSGCHLKSLQSLASSPLAPSVVASVFGWTVKYTMRIHKRELVCFNPPQLGPFPIPKRHSRPVIRESCSVSTRPSRPVITESLPRTPSSLQFHRPHVFVPARSVGEKVVATKSSMVRLATA